MGSRYLSSILSAVSRSNIDVVDRDPVVSFMLRFELASETMKGNQFGMYWSTIESRWFDEMGTEEVCR